LVLALCASAAGCALAWIAMKAVDTTLHQKAWAETGAEAVIGLNLPVLLFRGGDYAVDYTSLRIGARVARVQERSAAAARG
jgi:hypothetical protein